MNKEQKRIIKVLFLLSILFISLIVYLTYFELFRAEEVKNSSYNKRPANDEYVLRGSIYDRNKTLLAYSTKSNDDAQVRNYEYNNLYSHIIGYYDNIYGQSGLEKSYNSALSDSNVIDDVKNVFFQVLDNFKINEENIPLIKESQGHSLVLTIDHALQQYTKEQLGNRKGSIVVMNPKNGDILSMVNYPDFNPNDLSNNWEKISSDEENPLINRATEGLYTPGSIYKIITTTAALETEGIDTQFNCEGEINIGGFILKDQSAHGNVNLSEALIKSCNVSFGQIGVQLGQDNLNNISEKFMFNKKIPFDINTKKSIFPKNKMDKAEIGSTSIGQGKLEVTPLNMALMTSAIANNGEMMTPNLVKSVINSNGTIIEESEPKVLSTVTTSEIANNITEMMVDVVNQGTGTQAKINGINVAGKTGTAQNSGKDHVWFVAFAPAENPQIAISVLLENNGGSGGANAAPIARNIIIKALNNIQQ
ncbi:peptidoglycan glycosyltransferase [Clostridium sp. D2Q-14]|uniref:peptidoglycan D,D-transpeptidase FtsI family protein n=1 Tax=Anaeromonas gelatinilytica TaxID=2683194 RepID=UPI00193C29B3|nr:penicillin-binding transpeptidase domain-containing protein [Anaeromonas gelatinilytica]MBS4534326.1 peptidoglycan glycosyltransferase [Anaeromonas gelatinilytica]